MDKTLEIPNWLSEAAEATGWNVDCYKSEYNNNPYLHLSFECWSDLGEDIIEEFDFDYSGGDLNKIASKLISELFNRCESYDPDEHAEMWIGSRGKNGVPDCGIRDLLDDAEDIGKKLKSLYAAVLDAGKEI